MAVIKIQQPVNTRVSAFAFLDRYTDAEAIVIDLASIDDPAATQTEREGAAMLRRMNKKIDAASFIDLADEQTIAGVNGLVAFGLITAERGVEILQAPITAKERYE